MRIEHIAIWTDNLESMRDFYVKYFNLKSNKLYVNEKKGFSSYFLSFSDGARLEIMKRKDVKGHPNRSQEFEGYAHMAISVGSKEEVLRLTEELENDHYVVFGQPRQTGDGYFESVVLDPDGNKIEITI